MELKKVDLTSPAPLENEEQVVPSAEEPKKKFSLKTPKLSFKDFKFTHSWRIALGVSVFFLILFLAIAIPVYVTFQPLKLTLQSAQNTASALQSQDLVGSQKELDTTRDYLAQTQKKYGYLSWLKAVPIVRNYYLDGQHGFQGAVYALDATESLIQAIEPYADILGFKVKEGAQALDTGSAEDRIVFLAQTLEAISPQLEEVAGHLNKATEEINKINPKRYPTSIAGKPIRLNLIKLQEALDAAGVALTEARPLIKLLPDLLGQNEQKIYMLLFQNDAEIRPTGGFMTAYAYIQVDKGKLTPLDSYDIYDLDARWSRTLPAPEPIKKYLPLVNNWNLRDMNLNPDFKISMDTFMEHYNEISGVQRIDGIIALDTRLPVELLKVLGPVGVGGWGEFSADIDPRCDCPQVVYALEDITTRPTNYIREDRKAVLGPLMHSIVANAMGAPKAQWPQLLNVALTSIKEKHLLLYFNDETSQGSAEAFNAAGRILPFEGDYLHINDANFAGAKSNLFITQTVEQEINHNSDGTVSKVVTVTYDNPHPPSNCDLETAGLCLNGIYRDWIRLFVPLGSELQEVVGSEVAAVTGEDLGKTVFEAFFTLRPQSSSKLVFTYKLPGSYETPLPLLIQKQPGKLNIVHDIIYNGTPSEIIVEGDLEILLQF